MRRVVCAAALIGAVLLSGCQKKDVLVTRVAAVYTPAQVLIANRRLGDQAQTSSVPLPEGQMFLVIASRITNSTGGTQNFDQDKVEAVDDLGNTYSRIGLTADCSDQPSVMEYDGHLDKLKLKPGQTLAGDPQVTCFVFTVPAGDKHFSLRVPGAADTPAPMPAHRVPAAAPASAAPASGAPATVSADAVS